MIFTVAPLPLLRTEPRAEFSSLVISCKTPPGVSSRSWASAVSALTKPSTPDSFLLMTGSSTFRAGMLSTSSLSDFDVRALDTLEKKLLTFKLSRLPRSSPLSWSVTHVPPLT